jgi:hypothetical protein
MPPHIENVAEAEVLPSGKVLLSSPSSGTMTSSDSSIPAFLRISVVALYLQLRGGLDRDGKRSRLFRSVLCIHPILYTPSPDRGFIG